MRRASNQADQIALEHDPNYVAEPDTRTAAEKKAAREQRQQTAFDKVYGDPNQASSTLDPAPEDTQESSITFTAENLVEVLQGLPTDSAHGASGSTFSTLRAITLFIVPRDAPNVPADNPFLSGFLQLVNAWIKGALSPATLDLLNLSRAAFVPKGENDARCIGVGDAIYRARLYLVRG